MLLRRIHPTPGELDTDELAPTLALWERARADRPYVVANFAATVDGRATIDGRAGTIGDDADLELFLALRGCVDAIWTGINTLRIESYKRLVRKPERQQRRVAAGLAPEPLAVVVSTTGDVPWEVPMLADPQQAAVVYVPADPLEPPPRTDVALGVGTVDPAAVLQDLRVRHGVRALLCEGGPTLFRSLVDADLVDELFLTIAPKLAGGEDTPTILAGPLPEPARLRLDTLHERHGALFARYVRASEV